MNRVISWLKQIRLGRILTVFLAGVLLFFSTACRGVQAQPSSQVREEVPGNAVTQPYEGGMNEFSDVDPRRGTAEAQQKAKMLKNRVESNLDKSINKPGDYVKNFREGAPVGERTKRLGEDVGESAKELTKDVSKGTQRGLRNIKENTQSAAGGAAESAKRSAKNVKESTQQAAERAAENVSDTLD